MNTQIIAIANQKGGVGKTTTCENLGVGLAQAGKKVLLIDGDPQGSLTISLGHPQPDKLPFTLSDAMGRILMDEPLRPGEGILHHPEGVDLMPADIQLSGMEVSLVNAMSRETILRQYLDTLKGQYSHILIDCQPSLGMLTVNALAAANRIIIPVQAEYLPAKGLEQLLSTVSKVKRQAKQFRRWVTSEVLPTIRKHGAYMTREKLWEVATSPEALLKLCSELLAEREENAVLREENALLEGKAAFFDLFIDMKQSTNLRTTAKELVVPERRFVRFLLEQRFVYRTASGNVLPYAKPSNDGLFCVKDYCNHGHIGSYTLVTPQGKLYFAQLRDSILLMI